MYPPTVSPFENELNDEFILDTSSVFSKLSESDIVYTKKEPKLINGYLLGEALGKGAYAKVKEAVNVVSRQRVAAKIVNKKALRKIPGGEENVKTEIEIHQKLSHPNIVKLIDTFTVEDKNKLYIILEYLGGGSVQDLLDSAPNSCIPAAQGQSFFHDLVDAISYLHSLQIVHRDIKPGNMLLSLDGRVKLCDFGVAQCGSNIETNPTQGSPAFQPPEVAAADMRGAGFPGDVWAVGVTLYFILSGNLPFEGSTVYILFEAIAKGEYTMPEQFDDDLKELITSLMKMEPKERPTIDAVRSFRWYTKEIVPNEHLPIPQSPSFFGEDEAGLIVLPALNNVQCDVDETKRKSYKERCHCILA